MEISIDKSNKLKAVAVLMLLCIHLFNTLDYHGLFKPLIFIGDTPFIYYISLFCDACVPIFSFVTGYGLYYKYNQNKDNYRKSNLVRIKKLYINYWIILIIFAVLLGFMLQEKGYPGGWSKFLLNLTALNPTYNGAWWYFTIYVLFIISSSFWFRLLNILKPYSFLAITVIFYFIGFYFRIYQKSHSSEIMSYFQTQLALYFCTLFQFLLGSFALKYKLNTRISQYFSQFQHKNIISVLLIILLIVLHGFIPNFIIAPFTGLAFIFLFCQLNLGKTINLFLNFIAPHSLNIWLIHMFFYMIYFRKITYQFQYVPFIYLFLLICCLISSYIVKYLSDKVIAKRM